MSARDDDLALAGAVLQQRWRLVRLVGAGGIGVVYEAVSTTGPETVAIKLLRRELGDDAVVVARFLAEAEVSGRVTHPGVVRALGQGRAEDGTPYLVLPLLSGEPLSRLMNRGRVPVQRATAIACGLLDALAVAHAAGVVHRDLKPDNVFLVPSASGEDEVRILDFGLARVVDVAGGPARQTRTGVLLGTPGYMSPEQIRNAKDVGPHADLWSVAIILFEMLTGERAYAATNEFERMTKVVVEGPPSIAAAAPQYSHWEPFFARALAREPAQRYGDAVALRQGIEQTAGGSTAVSSSAVITAAFPAVAASGLLAPSAALGPAPTAPQVPVGPAPTPAGPFGGVHTAVSPGVRPAGDGATTGPHPNVHVVTPARRGYSLGVVLVASAAAALVGFVSGFAAGLVAGAW